MYKFRYFAGWGKVRACSSCGTTTVTTVYSLVAMNVCIVFEWWSIQLLRRLFSPDESGALTDKLTLSAPRPRCYHGEPIQKATYKHLLTRWIKLEFTGKKVHLFFLLFQAYFWLKYNICTWETQSHYSQIHFIYLYSPKSQSQCQSGLYKLYSEWRLLSYDPRFKWGKHIILNKKKI